MNGAGPASSWPGRRVFILAGIGFAAAAAAVIALFFWTLKSDHSGVTVIAVSTFDNDTGSPDYDRAVAGLSDLVVARLTKLDPMRLSVIGNAAVLRQPHDINDFKTIAANVKADYILFGQLQKDGTGLSFSTHFIRVSDNAQLEAHRLPVTDPDLGLQAAVMDEFERATREYVLDRPAS